MEATRVTKRNLIWYGVRMNADGTEDMVHGEADTWAEVRKIALEGGIWEFHALDATGRRMYPIEALSEVCEVCGQQLAADWMRETIWCPVDVRHLTENAERRIREDWAEEARWPDVDDKDDDE